MPVDTAEMLPDSNYSFASTFLDINECFSNLLNECHEHATCVNSEGNYSCNCNSGYQGNGTFCERGNYFMNIAAKLEV